MKYLLIIKKSLKCPITSTSIENPVTIFLSFNSNNKTNKNIEVNEAEWSKKRLIQSVHNLLAAVYKTFKFIFRWYSNIDWSYVSIHKTWQVYRNLELEKIKTRFYLPMSQNLKIKIEKGLVNSFFFNLILCQNFGVSANLEEHEIHDRFSCCFKFQFLSNFSV